MLANYRSTPSQPSPHCQLNLAVKSFKLQTIHSKWRQLPNMGIIIIFDNDAYLPKYKIKMTVGANFGAVYQSKLVICYNSFLFSCHWILLSHRN